MTQKAKDIMTKNPKSCYETAFIYDAVKVMADQNCGVVPITDTSDRCIGIVTDRDICLDVVLNRIDPQTTQLFQVMSHNVLTCHPDDSLHDVIMKMEKKKVRRAPVVDNKGQCIGIISEADIALKDKNRKEVAEMVGAISRK